MARDSAERRLLLIASRGFSLTAYGRFPSNCAGPSVSLRRGATFGFKQPFVEPVLGSDGPQWVGTCHPLRLERMTAMGRFNQSLAVDRLWAPTCWLLRRGMVLRARHRH